MVEVLVQRLADHNITTVAWTALPLRTPFPMVCHYFHYLECNLLRSSLSLSSLLSSPRCPSIIFYHSLTMQEAQHLQLYQAPTAPATSEKQRRRMPGARISLSVDVGPSPCRRLLDRAAALAPPVDCPPGNSFMNLVCVYLFTCTYTVLHFISPSINLLLYIMLCIRGFALTIRGMDCQESGQPAGQGVGAG